jgi:hypothetical protein
MAKKKIGKHLQFYKDCMKRGLLPKSGLCINTEDSGGPLSEELLHLFIPTEDELIKLAEKGHSTSYWGSGVITNDYDILYDEFSPLRQTIVLLMACLNNEL